MPLVGCSAVRMTDYDAIAAGLRADVSAHSAFAELVRAATLAPNGHNTQPWRFAEQPNGALIMPDFTRRTQVVDPDDHHLFVSLGCAAENMVIAAGAQGRPGAMRFVGDQGGRIELNFGSRTPRSDPLATAITRRQSTRSIYDGRPVAVDQLTLLHNAARIEGVSLTLITDKSKHETVLNFLLRGNAAQMDDAPFVAELLRWIRFNPEEAMASADGLFSKCSGSPALPTWIGDRFFKLFFTKSGEEKKYVAQLRSSAGVAVFVGDKADKDHWVRVGRSFQRFALQATALGIRHAMINQPVEVPSVRAEFAHWLGIGEGRPDLVVRFGHAPLMPMSLRRSARTVIMTA